MTKKRPAYGGKKNPGQHPSAEALQAKLKRLLEQQKYRQALDVLKSIQKWYPELTVTPSEAGIWLLRGQQQLTTQNSRQAIASCRRALELEESGESYYWLAKCLLADDRLEEALTLIGEAFARRTLPKDYGGCYLKLLCLKGDRATVRQLVAEQSKRFTASQLHWARGMLALQEDDFEGALGHFQKMKQNATPGDTPRSWIAYAQQQLQDWDAAATVLGTRQPTVSLFGEARLDRDVPVLERLGMLQAAVTNRPLLQVVDLQNDPTIPKREAAIVADIVRLVADGRTESAALALGELKLPSTQFPQLSDLQRAIYLLGGQRASQAGDLDEAEHLWGLAIKEAPFDRQLAVNLHAVLRANESYSADERLLNRLQQWLETEAKQNPQDWPERRLHGILAQLHCHQADSWLGKGHYRNALKALNQAERLCPDSPDVIGRRGLQALSDEDLDRATTLLRQALERGCRYDEVYAGLLQALEQLGDRQALREAKRRFGRHFSDFGSEYDFELSTWEEALATRSYLSFEELILETSDREAPERACALFVEGVEDKWGVDRVAVDLPAVGQAWDDLLQGLDATAATAALQAMCLCLQLLTKRKKGLAMVQNRYLDRLGELADRHPEAEPQYLAMASIRGTRLPQLERRLRQYLKAQPQPHVALAEIQLLVRRFCTIATLRPFLDEALQGDGENPLLLLAQATTYATDSEPYTELQERGFELARRLQDPRALAAFREETCLRSLASPRRGSLKFGPVGADGPPNMEEVLHRLAEQFFGRQLSQPEFEALLPELEAFLPSGSPDFNGGMPGFPEDDGDEFSGFESPPSQGKSGKPKQSRRQRKGFAS